MMDPRSALLDSIASAVCGLRVSDVVPAVEAALGAGLAGKRIVQDGLAEGMRRVGDKFAAKEYFVPEVLVASRVMYTGLAAVGPHIEADPAPSSGQIVLGVVRGDRHDIGKNIVKVMLESSGFTIHDLGRDVTREAFLDALRRTGAGILGLSTLMTTTMPEMRSVVESVRDSADLAHVVVLIGGAPTSPSFAESIRADGYAQNAGDALSLAKRASGAIP